MRRQLCGGPIDHSASNPPCCNLVLRSKSSGCLFLFTGHCKSSVDYTFGPKNRFLALKRLVLLNHQHDQARPPLSANPRPRPWWCLEPLAGLALVYVRTVRTALVATADHFRAKCDLADFPQDGLSQLVIGLGSLRSFAGLRPLTLIQFATPSTTTPSR
jgi:hypothetical protein